MNIPKFILLMPIFLVLAAISFAAKTSHDHRIKHKTTIIPLSEVRCSDLERAIDECDAADDVSLCRGRYDVKIAMCFRGK